MGSEAASCCLVEPPEGLSAIEVTATREVTGLLRISEWDSRVWVPYKI
jgi:hypothetical protein